MTGEKIEDIAQQVGYQNPFAFSNTFKRMTGFRPSQFRTRMGVRKTSDML
jgi:AraC-like DNA-binding protein